MLRQIFSLLCLAILMGTGMAVDVPFVFSDNLTSTASYTSDQIVSTSENSPDLVGVPTEESLQMENPYDARIEPENLIVREEVAKLKVEFSGEPSIENICAIFEYCMQGDNKTKGWLYINPPRGLNWQYANESIQIGRATGNVGSGDCADFAIFMSALVESVGGTSRIVCASQNNGDPGHAFAEVYLGQDSSQDGTVNNIINWLIWHYGTHKIYTHVDTDTKDVWLNLDWWAKSPGGPFFQADEYVIYNNRNQNPKIPLKTPPPQLYQSGRWYCASVDGDSARLRSGDDLNRLAADGHIINV